MTMLTVNCIIFEIDIAVGKGTGLPVEKSIGKKGQQ